VAILGSTEAFEKLRLITRGIINSRLVTLNK